MYTDVCSVVVKAAATWIDSKAEKQNQLEQFDFMEVFDAFTGSKARKARCDNIDGYKDDYSQQI